MVSEQIAPMLYGAISELLPLYLDGQKNLILPALPPSVPDHEQVTDEDMHTLAQTSSCTLLYAIPKWESVVLTQPTYTYLVPCTDNPLTSTIGGEATGILELHSNQQDSKLVYV
jgi:hypothetical protein